MKFKPWKYNFQIPVEGSDALRRYCLKIIESELFIARYAALVESQVDMGTKANEMIPFLSKLEVKVPVAIEPVDVEKVKTQFYRPKYLLELILSKHIETYQNYLSYLLQLIFVSKPETLKSSEKVEVASVLAHGTIEEFVKEYAEKKVESISYQSFSDLVTFFKERFKLDLVGEANPANVVKAIEIRNICVHNWGVINKRFIQKTGASESDIGKDVIIEKEFLEQLVPSLISSTARIDKEAVEKYSIARVAYQSEINSLINK